MKNNIILILLLMGSAMSSHSQSIIIAEIFADPTPTKGLPEKEFIELYNSSIDSLSLSDFYFNYNDKPVDLPKMYLKSNKYMIICKKGNELEFEKYGQVVGISVFSLNNEGAKLSLLDKNKRIVHEVNYTNKWYSASKNEGYSLEMIDKNYPCVGKSNWESSKAEFGATPGTLNSVSRSNPDVLGPILIVKEISENKIKLTFNEGIFNSSFPLISNFIIDNSAYTVKSWFIDVNSSEILNLELSKEIQIGDSFKLIIKQLEDCSKNVTSNIEAEFNNYVSPPIGSILISEILFDPLSGGSDFVELINKNNKKVNLKNWSFANLDKNKAISNVKNITKEDLVLSPNQHFAFSEDTTFLINTYPSEAKKYLFQLKELPSLNLDKGSVILLNEDNEIFDSLSYTNKMHSQIIKNTKGVSLERTNLQDSEGATAILSSASSEVNYATPGYANSQSQTDLATNSVWVEPEIFNPYQNNDNMMTYLNYNLTTNNTLCSIQIYDKTGLIKSTLRSNTILGTTGKIEWDGKNNSGQLLPVGYYVFKIELIANKKTETLIRKVVLASF